MQKKGRTSRLKEFLPYIKMYMYNTSFYIKIQLKKSPSEYKYKEVQASVEYLQDLEFEPYHLCEKSIKQINCNSKTIESLHFTNTTRKDLLCTEVCPNCDNHPLLKAHGTRYRSFRDGSTGKTYYIEVVRKYCSECNKYFTVLPHFLHSYKVITASVIHDTLIFILKRSSQILKLVFL